MISARQGRESETYTHTTKLTDVGCQVLIYPGAFNMTTGPLHWELLQRARCVAKVPFALEYSS